MNPANDHFPAGHPRHIPEAWPKLLSRDQVCAYIGVSAETLAKVCPIAPVNLGANLIRYHRDQVDAWIDTLPPRLPGLRMPRASVEDAPVARNDPEPADDRAMDAIERARARARGEMRCRKTA